MGADIAVVLAGFGSVAIFLSAHFIVFRFLKAEQLFKGIIATFAAGLLCAVIIALTAVHTGAFVERLGYFILVLIIYCTASFFYILCFFGPYETSIRIRLVRELARPAEGLLLSELLTRYNTAFILDKRLKRLLGSGDIAQEEGKFYIRKKQNVFFAIDVIAQKMHAFIHSD